MLPKSTVVEVNGQTLRVPFDKHENATANKILAAQMRNAVSVTLKRVHDEEAPLSPKELNDLSMAIKNIGTFSKEVYEASDPIGNPKPTDPVEVDAEDVDFTPALKDTPAK